MVLVMITIAVVVHLLACAWHLVCQDGEGLDADVRPSSDWSHNYLSALHWSAAQVHSSPPLYPRSSVEFVFGIVAMFITFISRTVVIAVLTTLVMRVSATIGDKRRKILQLQSYLAENGVSAATSRRVMGYAEERMSKRVTGASDVELFRDFPSSLLMAIEADVR